MTFNKLKSNRYCTITAKKRDLARKLLPSSQVSHFFAAIVYDFCEW